MLQVAGWEDKLVLLGMASRARAAVEELRTLPWDSMVMWVHFQSPCEKAKLHHQGMAAFRTHGWEVNRVLLMITAPTFMKTTRLTNALSLGNNKIDHLMIRDIYIYTHTYTYM